MECLLDELVDASDEEKAGLDVTALLALTEAEYTASIAMLPVTVRFIMRSFEPVDFGELVPENHIVIIYAQDLLPGLTVIEAVKCKIAIMRVSDLVTIVPGAVGGELPLVPVAKLEGMGGAMTPADKESKVVVFQSPSRLLKMKAGPLLDKVKGIAARGVVKDVEVVDQVGSVAQKGGNVGERIAYKTPVTGSRTWTALRSKTTRKSGSQARGERVSFYDASRRQSAQNCS
jgi:hypothetical protein